MLRIGTHMSNEHRHHSRRSQLIVRMGHSSCVSGSDSAQSTTRLSAQAGDFYSFGFSILKVMKQRIAMLFASIQEDLFIPNAAHRHPGSLWHRIAAQRLLTRGQNCLAQFRDTRSGVAVGADPWRRGAVLRRFAWPLLLNLVDQHRLAFGHPARVLATFQPTVGANTGSDPPWANRATVRHHVSNRTLVLWHALARSRPNSARSAAPRVVPSSGFREKVRRRPGGMAPDPGV
jgi:hypothetical protein